MHSRCASLPWTTIKINTMKFDDYVLWTLGVALVLLIAYFLGTTLFKQFRQEADYESRQFHGRLIGLEDVGRGQYLLTIKQEHGDTLAYYLPIKWFIKKNNIQTNDSVSKGQNAYAMRFFKKQNGEYVNCCVYGI